VWVQTLKERETPANAGSEHPADVGRDRPRLTTQGSVDPVLDRSERSPGDEAAMSQVVVECSPVDPVPIPPVQTVGFLEDQGDVQRRLSRVVPIRDQRIRSAGGRAVPSEADPQVPVREVHQPWVECSCRGEGFASHDDGRTTSRNEVGSGQLLDHVPREGRRHPPDDLVPLVDLDHAGVHPGATGLGCGLELSGQFPGCPEVVVIEERDPIASGLIDASVAGGADPMS
jgi:hypothetical protein